MDDPLQHPEFDSSIFRDVVGRFASGVTVITTRDGGQDFGMTASAMSSLSLDPPMILICVNRRAASRQAISHARVFGVNILHEDQASLAGPSKPDQIECVPLCSANARMCLPQERASEAPAIDQGVIG